VAAAGGCLPAGTGTAVRQHRQNRERRDVASFQTSLWWAMVQRDISSRWGALANVTTAVARDRAVAAQRAEAERALARLQARSGGRGTQAS
jgi:hypothetical protein